MHHQIHHFDIRRAGLDTRFTLRSVSCRFVLCLFILCRFVLCRFIPLFLLYFAAPNFHQNQHQLLLVLTPVERSISHQPSRNSLPYRSTSYRVLITLGIFHNFRNTLLFRTFFGSQSHQLLHLHLPYPLKRLHAFSAHSHLLDTTCSLAVLAPFWFSVSRNQTTFLFPRTHTTIHAIFTLFRIHIFRKSLYSFR